MNKLAWLVGKKIAGQAVSLGQTLKLFIGWEKTDKTDVL